jgi:hypothetical protein
VCPIVVEAPVGEFVEQWTTHWHGSDRRRSAALLAFEEQFGGEGGS